MPESLPAVRIDIFGIRTRTQPACLYVKLNKLKVITDNLNFDLSIARSILQLAGGQYVNSVIYM